MLAKRAIAAFIAIALASTVAGAGCATPTRDRGWFERTIEDRTRHALGNGAAVGAQRLPPGVVAEDGIDPDEATAVALWSSPALQAELTSLDSAVADVDEAGRLPNPRLSLLAPIDPRQLSLILAWPIEALWLAPLRTEAANRELERVAELLVQIVLDLERDVRLGHADALLAHARIEVREKLAFAWKQSADLADARGKAGDIAPVEAASIRAEATIADDAIARARLDAEIADARLLALLGAPWPRVPRLVPSPAHAAALPGRDALIVLALRQRPDLRAAELAIHAGAVRARWERWRVLALTTTLDGQAPVGKLAPNFSLGAQLDLPIFSQNQGGVGRADASVARAGYRYAAARLSVTAEVVAAHAALERSRASLRAYDRVLVSLDEAEAAARRAHDDGAESYLVVIDALRRSSDARLRRIELDAELTRAEAELTRAVGGLRALETR